jgi:hypothetical protein
VMQAQSRLNRLVGFVRGPVADIVQEITSAFSPINCAGAQWSGVQRPKGFTLSFEQVRKSLQRPRF